MVKQNNYTRTMILLKITVVYMNGLHFLMLMNCDDFDNEFERLTFKFGEPIESVTKKLKNRNYSLLNEEIKIKEL
jgi:hypothetical protein